jgi:hypothetical protein
VSYYNRKGEPIELMKWARLFENIDYKVVQQDQLPGVLVSTVWLGLDHSFGGTTPLIFETMTFPTAESGLEQEQDRYSTEREAREGHARILAAARAALEKAKP